MSDATELKPGVVLSGTYELTRLIGSGGMGSVWEARHLRLPKKVAIKVLNKAIEASEEAALRFRREAEVASQLGHPNIVEALDFNALPDGKPYLVLELLRGQSLRDRLKLGPLPLTQTVAVVRQVSSALVAAHGHGVVHRDLKPENLFLCEHEGQEAIHVKILDFGLSKIMQSQTNLTHDGAVFGTPMYMAPEQARGQQAAAHSDQYALAVMTYEMLAGTTPFSGDKPMQVMFQTVNEPPPPLIDRVPGLPPAVNEVVLRGLAKDPAARFDAVCDFASALSRAAGIPSAPPTATNLSPVAVVGCGYADLVTAPTLPSGQQEVAQVGTTPSTSSADLDVDPARSATVTPGSSQGAAAGATASQAPIAPPGGGTPVALIVGLVVVGLAVAGGVTWWLLRTGDGGSGGDPATEPAPVRAHGGGDAADKVDTGARATSRAVAGLDGRGPDGARVGTIRGANAAGANAAGANAAGANGGDRGPDVRTRTGTRERTGPAPVPGAAGQDAALPAAARQIWQQAELALQQQQFDRARTLGERLSRELPLMRQGPANAVLARAYCGNQDKMRALGYFKSLPPRARRRVLLFCKQHLDFP